MDEGAWWAAVYGVAQSRTRLKRLSSDTTTISQITSKVGQVIELSPGHAVREQQSRIRTLVCTSNATLQIPLCNFFPSHRWAHGTTKD